MSPARSVRDGLTTSTASGNQCNAQMDASPPNIEPRAFVSGGHSKKGCGRTYLPCTGPHPSTSHTPHSSRVAAGATYHTTQNTTYLRYGYMGCKSIPGDWGIRRGGGWHGVWDGRPTYRAGGLWAAVVNHHVHSSVVGAGVLQPWELLHTYPHTHPPTQTSNQQVMSEVHEGTPGYGGQ